VSARSGFAESPHAAKLSANAIPYGHNRLYRVHSRFCPWASAAFVEALQRTRHLQVGQLGGDALPPRRGGHGDLSVTTA